MRSTLNSPSQLTDHQLIQGLLTCESGPEQATVSADPDLMDAALVRLMEIEAANLAQRSN